MKIADIRTRVLLKPLDGTVRNPRFVWTAKQTLLVFVLCDDGTHGVGEIWSDAGSAEPIVAFIERDLKPRLVGRDPDLVERFWADALGMGEVSTRRNLTHAGMSGIDIALWDIKGKRARRPVWRLMGGDGGPVLPYASGGLYREGQGADAFGREYGAFVAQGFGAVKIKVGGAAVAADAARVAALRAHCGDALVMVDAVSNYDLPTAFAFARAVAPHGLTWFEQPLRIADVAGMARLNRDCGIPLCGVENEMGLAAFRRLIEADAVHFVQFDPVVSGGLTEGRKIAALAEAFHKPVTLHCSNSIVSMAANLHLAAALPNCHSVEYHVIHQPLFERAPPGLLALKDGRIAPPEAPGLGLDLADLIPGETPR